MPAPDRRYSSAPACLIALASGTLLFASPAIAAAQSFSGQIALASEYVGKGLGKSDGAPAVSGSVEFEHGGFYAGAFASSADVSSGAHAEIITTVGRRSTLGGMKFDLQVMNRDLPGTRAGVDRNYWEYQLDATKSLGRVNARLRINYTPDGFAATREAWWVELQGTVVLDARTRISAAIADRSAQGGADYTAWHLGLKRNLTRDVSADIRWHDTDGHRFGEPYEGRLTGALTYAF